MASTVKSCNDTLSVLRKFKHTADFRLRRQYAEVLILSKLYYNMSVCHLLPYYWLNCVQRTLNAAATFVCNKYFKGIGDQTDNSPTQPGEESDIVRSCSGLKVFERNLKKLLFITQCFDTPVYCIFLRSGRCEKEVPIYTHTKPLMMLSIDKMQKGIWFRPPSPRCNSALALLTCHAATQRL